MATTYKIGEAAALLNLKTYVLRFWETEFPDIVPLRTDKGQRLYTEENLALLERIRFLLHERGLTIEGARKALLEDKEKGLIYTFAPGQSARPVAAGGDAAGGSDPADGFGTAGGPETAGAPETGVEDGLERQGGGWPGESPGEAGWNADGGASDGAARLVEDAGTAVKRFLSQYNLPGISKTYPIHDPPLRERREFVYRDAALRSGRGAPSASPESASLPSASGGDDFAYLLEGALNRRKSDASVFLHELAAELENIAGLLRGDDPLS